MVRVVLLTSVCLFAAAAAASAAPLPHPPGASPAAAIDDISAQRRTKRSRPVIRVTPRYPYRTFHSAYPLPYDIEYPGPNAVRHCVNRYVTEARPSGPVIVPRMRCWWAPR